MSFKLEWDKTGERVYETGVDRGVVYPMSKGEYPMGEAWNGLTNVTLTPSGAEATPLYANNHKYLNLMSVEELGGTIEAYMFPDAFAECNGLKELAPGVLMGQQKRKTFGFCFRNLIGNDEDGTAYGYKIHLVYGCLASPSEQANATVNDSPEAKTMSFEFTTTPVEVTVGDATYTTASIEIDSTKVAKEKLAALEAVLYGSGDTEARLPLPSEVAELIGTEAAAG
jgi:hypothetical protein